MISLVVFAESDPAPPRSHSRLHPSVRGHSLPCCVPNAFDCIHVTSIDDDDDDVQMCCPSLFSLWRSFRWLADILTTTSIVNILFIHQGTKEVCYEFLKVEQKLQCNHQKRSDFTCRYSQLCHFILTLYMTLLSFFIMAKHIISQIQSSWNLASFVR